MENNSQISDLEAAKIKLEEAGAEERKNGIVLSDGTVVGTVEDNQKVADALTEVVKTSLATGKFKTVKLDLDRPAGSGKT